MEQIINYLSQIPWYAFLAAACLITFIENIFPPSPSDSLLVFMGAMAAMGHVGYVPLLLASTLGSTLGFAAMYWLGSKFDKKVIHAGKFRFLSSEGLLKAEDWFRRYGLWLIVANRFLTGTRAVISFFAGMSRLQFSVTVLLSAISALVWNTILIYLGAIAGDNWKIVDYYMSLYGKIILPIAIIIIGFLAWRWYRSNFGGPAKPRS